MQGLGNAQAIIACAFDLFIVEPRILQLRLLDERHERHREIFRALPTQSTFQETFDVLLSELVRTVFIAARFDR